MRKPIEVTLAAMFLVTVVGVSGANAGPLDTPGAQKAMICSACHGPGGNSPNKSVPALAGMDQAYFKQTIQAFAEGKRQSTEMEPYSKYVLEFGVDEIANYFAAQKRAVPAKSKAAGK